MTVTAPASPTLAFRCEVDEVERLSPSFLRLWLRGDDLRHLHDGGALGPRDTRLKLLVGVDGDPDVPVPTLTPTWYADWRRADPAERGVLRTYTLRRVDGPVDDRRVALDVVLHGEPGHAGPAVTFARAARPGDRVTLLGPNAATGGYGGLEWRPPAASPDRPVEVLLVGDETAVPAVASVLERLPHGYRGEAVLEVPCAEDVQDLRVPPGVRVTWLARGDRPRGEATLAAVRALRPALAAPADAPDGAEDLLWEVPAQGGSCSWVAGEAAGVREVRRHLVRDAGLDRRTVAFMGYWREGRAEGS